MAGWSSFAKVINKALLQNSVPKSTQNVKFSLNSALRSGHDGPRLMPMQPSRWQWHKFKDMLHYYTMVGAIPCTLVILYCNIFIGPAQLQPIPEGYEPKVWEYHRHPITRFLARYVYNNPQQDYEKYMHYVDEESERMKLRALEEKIREKMAERLDYQAYFFRPVTTKYLQAYRQAAEEMDARLGDE